jgi:hypothetical protein
MNFFLLVTSATGTKNRSLFMPARASLALIDRRSQRSVKFKGAKSKIYKTESCNFPREWVLLASFIARANLSLGS